MLLNHDDDDDSLRSDELITASSSIQEASPVSPGDGDEELHRKDESSEPTEVKSELPNSWPLGPLPLKLPSSTSITKQKRKAGKL